MLHSVLFLSCFLNFGLRASYELLFHGKLRPLARGKLYLFWRNKVSLNINNVIVKLFCIIKKIACKPVWKKSRQALTLWCRHKPACIWQEAIWYFAVVFLDTTKQLLSALIPVSVSWTATEINHRCGAVQKRRDATLWQDLDSSRGLVHSVFQFKVDYIIIQTK